MEYAKLYPWVAYGPGGYLGRAIFVGRFTSPESARDAFDLEPSDYGRSAIWWSCIADWAYVYSEEGDGPRWDLYRDDGVRMLW